MHVRDRLVLVGGQAVPIRGRALDVLAALAGRPGGLVTKDELLQRVWRGLIAEDGNLHVQVCTLRRVLGRGAIVTVPGHGYRLLLKVVLTDCPPRSQHEPVS